MAFSCLLSVLVRTLSKRERLAHKTTTHEDATRSFNKVFSASRRLFFLCVCFFSGISVDADVGLDEAKNQKRRKKDKKILLATGSEYLEARNHATRKKTTKTLGFSRQEFFFYPPHQL